MPSPKVNLKEKIVRLIWPKVPIKVDDILLRALGRKGWYLLIKNKGNKSYAISGWNSHMIPS